MLKIWFDTFKGILMKKQIMERGQKNPPAFQAAFPAIENVYAAFLPPFLPLALLAGY